MGIVPQFWIWDKSVVLSLSRVFLFFSEIMPPETNTVPGYYKAWDNTLSSMLYILRYALNTFLS